MINIFGKHREADKGNLSSRCHSDTMRPKRSGSITIKELHAKTGEKVREAALSDSPVEITDRGKRIAFLVSARLVRSKPRTRKLLPEFKAYLAKPVPKTDSILKDLEAVRADR